MKTRHGAFWGITGAVLASICGCSLCSGQIVTQPPSKAPNPGDHIAVAPVAPVPHFEPPPAPIAAPPLTQRVPVKAPVVLPDLPYVPLLQKDAKGNIIPLTEPPEYAALRVNPMLKPADLDRFTPYLRERRAAFEKILTDNLDLLEQIEGGLFETLDLTPKESFTKLLNVSKPLREPSAPKGLINELLDRQLVDATQAEFNRKIVNEYHFAILPDVKPDATPEEKGQHARRSLALIYKRGLDEPLFVHRQMLIEASGKLDKIIPALNLDKATADKVNAAARTIKPDTADTIRLKAMADINAALSLDQRKNLLRQVVATRGK